MITVFIICVVVGIWLGGKVNRAIAALTGSI
jgi:hypothetical protein